MTPTHYKKSWLTVSAIARDLLNQNIGDRLYTVNEYTEKLKVSRGIIQNAFQLLQENQAVTIEKRGKIGSFIESLDIAQLFELADIKFITGSMPTPLQSYLAGLATGICHTMKICPVPFTFAFVQGGANRVNALDRLTYDFIVTSKATALYSIAENPSLEIALELKGAIYSPPYVVYSRNPDFQEITHGMRVAVDPTATDQQVLTHLLCRNKDVTVISRPYTGVRLALLSGEVDFIVYRNEDWPDQEPDIYCYPIEWIDMKDYLLPVVLVNKKNYGMGKILEKYLFPELIAERQRAVIDKVITAQFY